MRLLTPMQGRIRGNRVHRRGCPQRARPMPEFDANIPRAERHELRKSLRCVRVGYAFDELVHRTYSVRPDVRARVVEDHVQHKVE